MSLLELIADNERDIMAHQVHHYSMSNGDYASNMGSWNANHVLREWDWAKSQYLSKVFGEQLILKREVEFNKGLDEIMGELDEVNFPNCLNELIGIFDSMTSYLDAPTWMSEKTRLSFKEKVPECLHEVSSAMGWELRRTVYALCSNHNLATNSYEGVTVEIPLPTGKSLKVNRGCRALKTLGKLIEGFGLDMKEFEQYRIKHSQILNQKKLKGTLCISIHPLDYVTMSDNDSGWESCMSWENSGCYRQGTVEMMNSTCVVVAYLEAEFGNATEYVVTYNANGGSGSVESETVVAGESVVLDNGSGLTYTSHTFKGWGTNPSATQVLTSPYTPTGDVTLYAVWEEN